MKRFLIASCFMFLGLHAVTAEETSDYVSRGKVLLKTTEPELSKYEQAIGGIATHGWHLDLFVTYRLKEIIKTDSSALKQYVTNAFLAANWTNGLPPDVKSEMHSPSGEVIKPIGFRKEPFQPKPGDFAPEYVTVYFLNDGTELQCTYVFRHTKEAQPGP